VRTKKIAVLGCLIVAGILMSVVPILASAAEADITQGKYSEDGNGISCVVDSPEDAPPKDRPRLSSRTASSQIASTSENVKTFRTDTAPELDWYQPCNGGDNLIDFYINVHDVDVSTIKSATLTLAVWDVDYYCGGACGGLCERDAVYINGHRLTTPELYLTGANNQWSTCTFNVEPEWIIEGDNYVEIDIDLLSRRCWCVECDWGELRLELVDVKVVEIEALEDIDIKDGAGNDITDPIWKHDEPSKYDPIADAMKNRFIFWTYPGSLKIKTTIDAFPTKPSWEPKCKYDWQISGTDKHGTGEFTGWSGEFKVDMPQEVGKYTLTLAFTLYDDENNEIKSQHMSHILYVTYENSKLPKPKTTWLDKATDWASGAANPSEVGSYIDNPGIYTKSNWRYRDSRIGGLPNPNFGNWLQLFNPLQNVTIQQVFVGFLYP